MTETAKMQALNRLIALADDMVGGKVAALENANKAKHLALDMDNLVAVNLAVQIKQHIQKEMA
jgi:hypothetical protein